MTSVKFEGGREVTSLTNTAAGIADSVQIRLLFGDRSVYKSGGNYERICVKADVKTRGRQGLGYRPKFPHSDLGMEALGDPKAAADVAKTLTENVRAEVTVRKGILSYHEEELKRAQTIQISVDLVLAAKRQLGFLRTIDSITSLHRGPAVLHAIRRLV